MSRKTIESFASSLLPADKADSKRKGELLERLKLVVKVVSGRDNLDITTEVDQATAMSMAARGVDADKQWFHSTQTDPETGKVVKEYVHIPSEIYETEESALGKAAHEAGHVAITRFGKFIPEEVCRMPGFITLMHASEERPTDQVVKDRYSGAGKWLKAARQESVQDSASMISAESLGRIPKYAQIMDLIVYMPYFSTKPACYDDDVLVLYNKIKDDVEAMSKTLPEPKSGENQIINKAIDRYCQIYEKIWPQVRHLVDKDIENQKISEALKMSKNGEAELTKELNDLLDNLPPDVIEALTKTQDSKDAKRVSEAMQKAMESDEDIDQNSEKEKENTAENNIEEIIKQKILDAIENLPDAAKAEIENKALEQIKQLDEKIQKAIKKKIMDVDSGENSSENKVESTGIETNEGEDALSDDKEDETTRTVEQIEAERDEALKIKEEMARIEKRLKSVETDKGMYEQAFQEMRGMINSLYSRLNEIFHPRRKGNIELRRAGSKINLKAVYKFESEKNGGAPAVDYKIFESKDVPKKQDYAFTLLIDLSGSMQSGGKAQGAFMAAILLAESLSRIGIKTEILGFQDEIIVFKHFDERMSDAVRSRMSGMVAEIHGGNPGGHNQPSYNDDGPCLKEASDGLARVSCKDKFLIVFSDGVPEGRRSDSRDLHVAIEQIRKSTDQKLIAFGIGSQTDHLREFYPTSFPNLTVEELSELLSEVLEDAIINPKKYK